MKESFLATYLNPLSALILDPNIIEVAINADGVVWSEYAGKSQMVRVDAVSFDARALADLCSAIAKSQKLALLDTSPLVSTTIEYGDVSIRAQIVAPPASYGAHLLSFRVFRPRSMAEPKKFRFLRDQTKSLEEERAGRVKALRDLVLSANEDQLLKELIGQRFNVIISGGTSTGKTELGRRLLWMVAPWERLVTIEDSRELMPKQPNVVSLIADRKDNSARSADLLLQATLRLRPDRIILGELRGREATTFLQAINTGHSGSFTTIHAESARKALDRLALMVLETGTRLSYADVVRSLRGSIDVIIQTGRQGDDRGILEVYFPSGDEI